MVIYNWVWLNPYTTISSMNRVHSKMISHVRGSSSSSKQVWVSWHSFWQIDVSDYNKCDADSTIFLRETTSTCNSIQVTSTYCVYILHNNAKVLTSFSGLSHLKSLLLLLTILQFSLSATGVGTRPPTVPYLCWRCGISLYLSGITRRPPAISGYLYQKCMIIVRWGMMWLLLRIVLPATFLTPNASTWLYQGKECQLEV